MIDVSRITVTIARLSGPVAPSIACAVTQRQDEILHLPVLEKINVL